MPTRRETRTILLVEDDTEMRSMLAAALRRDGYVVVAVGDGDEALEWLGIGVLDGRPARLPAIVVSDIRVPFFSGLDLAEGLQHSGTSVPIILITGFADPETHARARELGACCVLDKPFAMHRLRLAVREALRAEDPSAAADSGLERAGA